jgi:HEAT repeat protein
MNRRLSTIITALTLAGTAPLVAQAQAKEPESDGRPLSEWVADLKALSPQTRNAAAYEIAGLGPAAAAAVPALIEALADSQPAVRFPVTVALREIGPAAKAAVPALKKVYEEDINDEVASSARRAIKAIAPEETPKD